MTSGCPHCSFWADNSTAHPSAFTPGMPDREGASAFFRDDGTIYHTYSTYGRGIDLLNGAYNFIDISTLGRHEDPSYTQSWVRRHDEYDHTEGLTSHP